MAWIGLLALMLIVSAAPGVSIYLEHLRAARLGDAPDGEGPRTAI